MLRTTVGLTAVAAGAASLIEPAAQALTLGAIAIAVVALACGVLLLIGFLTPAVAVLIALGSASAALPGGPRLATAVLEAKPTAGFMIVMAVAVVLLGPGAYSLDGYLFGRREIVIPQFKKAASDRQASSE